MLNPPDQDIGDFATLVLIGRDYVFLLQSLPGAQQVGIVHTYIAWQHKSLTRCTYISWAQTARYVRWFWQLTCNYSIDLLPCHNRITSISCILKLSHTIQAICKYQISIKSFSSKLAILMVHLSCLCTYHLSASASSTWWLVDDHIARTCLLQQSLVLINVATKAIM